MVDSDGKTHLDKPYCALQKECFGGIVGAKSPYVDGMGLLGELSVVALYKKPDIKQGFLDGRLNRPESSEGVRPRGV